MRRPLKRAFLGSLALLLSGGMLMALEQKPSEAPHTEEDTDMLMSLIELMNTPVVSASKSAEKLIDAPATVIVLRNEDLRNRGYHQLSQILDDLPGMQPNRIYGDYYVKNYWRGFRNTQGDPYLLMVDGLVMNSLYYNAVEWALVTIPMSNVDRIEVVYGPASAIYGSNAFMGVINVITVKDRGQNGSGHNLLLTSGSSALRVADAQYLHKNGDFRLSVTARLENSLLDSEASQSYEYSKDKYYSDRRIWGKVAESPTLGGGAHHSETISRALDLRAQWGKTEAGIFYHTLKTGYGNEYPADKVPNNAIWGRKHLSLFVRQKTQLASGMDSSTTLRYLETGITPDSFFIMAYPGTGVPMGIDFQYYSVQNSSWSLNQDFEYRHSSAVSLNFGLKYERKDLQKAYDLSPYYWKPTSDFDPGAADFPKALHDTHSYWNRVMTEDRGVYVQGRYRFNEMHSVIMGGRWDNNSKYGDAKTARIGYVGNIGSWSLKALFGQAYNEPTPVSLYASWKGSGADPSLNPEKSSTLELSGSYTKEHMSALVSLWSVKNTETIVSKQNLGEQKFTGIDLHLRTIFQPQWARQCSAWGYISKILKNEGRNNPDSSGIVSKVGLTEDGHVGDIAADQIKAGATLELSIPLSLTLLARYVGGIDTIASNPLGRVDAYLTADFIAEWRAVFGVRGLSLTVKLANLSGKEYFHPGYDAANAGNRPGAWVDGAWKGSAGWYNSLLAQPGRSLQISMGLNY